MRDRYYKVQDKRRVAEFHYCPCGGRIEMYDVMLGTCPECRRDFSVIAKRGRKYEIKPLVDHRRDLY